MDGCKQTTTPCKPHTQLLAIEGTILEDPSFYRSLVEALQYLTFIRPDVHFGLVKRILSYVQGTMKYGLTYSASQDNSITAYSNSDWVANPNIRRSITSFVVFMGQNIVSWQSKKQGSISRSST